MEERPYGFVVVLPVGMHEAEERVRAALAAEGFGIIAEIDVAAILHAKLGLERPPYKILGACNPHLASRALAAEPDVGVLLPCNVALYPEAGSTTVAAIDPGTMARLSPDPTVAAIAVEARERIGRALESLQA